MTLSEHVKSVFDEHERRLVEAVRMVEYLNNLRRESGMLMREMASKAMVCTCPTSSPCLKCQAERMVEKLLPA